MQKRGIKFGTDGWRAVIGEDYTFENLKIISQAVADYLKKNKPRDFLKVVVGYDTRFMSYKFAQVVSSVFSANRIRVLLSKEPIPTPVVSLTTLRRGLDLGIMITASHNPYYFNGFKIKDERGASASLEITSKVEDLLYKTKPRVFSLDGARRKGLLKEEDLTKEYVRFIRNYLNFSLIKKLKMRVVVDLMHGSGNSYLERIFKGSRVKFSYLRKEINPYFGGVNPEPVEKNLSQLIEVMRGKEFDLGLALDGDGDRVACVLRGGRYIGAQTLLPLLALHLAENRKFSGGIVKTVVGSNLIDSVALDLGRILFETPVGFKYISELFKEEDILIGGEEAGGIGVKGYIPERDGTMAFSLFLEMLAYTRKSPQELVRDLETKYGRWYYSRTFIPLSKKEKILLKKIRLPKKLLGEKVERINNLDGLKLIGNSSWLMFRASGTEPIIRIYSEAKTKKRANQLIALGKTILSSQFKICRTDF